MARVFCLMVWKICAYHYGYRRILLVFILYLYSLRQYIFTVISKYYISLMQPEAWFRYEN